MDLLCAACHRLLPPASWKIVAGELRLTCAGCGTVSVLPAKSPTTEPRVSHEDMPGVAPPHGPGGRESAEAAHDPRVRPASTDAPTWLDEEWDALSAHWGDPEAHRKILARADALEDLPSLGRRYKEHLDADPNDVVARRARDELIKRASAKLLVTAPGAPARSSARNIIVAAALLIAAGLLVGLLVQVARTVGAP